MIVPPKKIDADGRVSDFVEGRELSRRRQDLPELHALNGALYLARRDLLLERNELLPEPSYAYGMPGERSLDLDDAWDLRLLRWIMEERHHEAA